MLSISFFDSGYEKFKNQNAEIFSRGNAPLDLGGYGVTYGYAYAYDPEGKLIEMEQLDKVVLDKDGYNVKWQE